VPFREESYRSSCIYSGPLHSYSRDAVSQHPSTRAGAESIHLIYSGWRPPQGGMLDDFPMDPSLARPESWANTSPLDNAIAPVFRNNPRQLEDQTSPTERPQPIRADGGVQG